MVRFLVACALLVGLLSTTAWADEPMFAEQPGRRGILYAVHVHGGMSPTLYLFGTIHVATAKLTPFSHAVKTALAGTQRLALEADPTNITAALGAMMTLGRYRDGDSLAKHLPPKVLADLRAVMTKEHVSDDQVMGIKLWAVPSVLSMPPLAKVGLDSQYGADMWLAAWAKEHKVPIVELEGFDFQLKLLSAGTEPEQLALLVDELDEMKKKDFTKMIVKLVDEWGVGDEKGIEKDLLDDKDKSEVAKKFEARLLDERNVGMADKAEQLMKQPGDTFLAVGSAHLLGKKGLVQLMKQRGYDVRAVR